MRGVGIVSLFALSYSVGNGIRLTHTGLSLRDVKIVKGF